MIMLVYHRARLLLLLARLSFLSGVSCNDPGRPWANGCLKFSPALTSRSTPSFNKGPELGHRRPFIFLLLFREYFRGCKAAPFQRALSNRPLNDRGVFNAGNSSEGLGLDTVAHIFHEYVLTESSGMRESP